MSRRPRSVLPNMWHSTITTTLCALALLCGACDSNEEADNAEANDASKKAPAVYACNAPSENESNCVEWRGGAFADEDAARQECEANRGTFVGNACPAQNTVARCIRHRGSMMEQHEVWYGPKVTAQTVEFGCKGPDTEYQAG